MRSRLAHVIVTIRRGRAAEDSLGAVLQAWRKSLRIPQGVLALQLGVSQSYLCDLEHDNRNPSDKLLQSLQTLIEKDKRNYA